METSCGIFIFDKSGNVLICCPRGVRTKEGWTIPKGKQEKDESFKEAAIRETREETGLNLSSFKSKMKEIGTKKYKHKKKKLVAFVLFLEKSIDCDKLACENTEKPEITKYEMVSPKDAVKRLHYVQADLLDEYLKEK